MCTQGKCRASSKCQGFTRTEGKPHFILVLGGRSPRSAAHLLFVRPPPPTAIRHTLTPPLQSGILTLEFEERYRPLQWKDSAHESDDRGNAPGRAGYSRR